MFYHAYIILFAYFEDYHNCLLSFKSLLGANLSRYFWIGIFATVKMWEIFLVTKRTIIYSILLDNRLVFLLSIICILRILLEMIRFSDNLIFIIIHDL